MPDSIEDAMAGHALRVVVADDEAPARQLLRFLCEEHDALVVGEAATSDEALDTVRRLRPDLALLDIAMPGMGGIAVARGLAILPGAPSIAFTTADDRHALAAFDIGVIDYLLKPIADDRFAVMLARARAARASGRDLRPDDHLWVPVRSGLERVSVDAIERVTAERDYVRIALEGRSHLLRATMDDLSGKLDAGRFLRVHRSCFVRRDLATGLRHDGGGAWSVVLSRGEPARIGRSYLAAVRSAIGPR